MKSLRSRVLSFLLIFSLFVSLVGMINVDTTYAASKKIHIKKKTVTLSVGSKYQQKLIAKNGKKIKATKVKWKSKKPSVAKINKKGKIVAVRAGTAKMTAKYKGKTYKFTVKVKKPLSNAERLYNYVKDYGHSVNSDYMVPGNSCIEVTGYGSDYSIVYIVSVDSNDTSKIYFASYKTIYEPGSYKDTVETTSLTYEIGSGSGYALVFQLYYSGSSLYHFVTSGTVTYANYTGASYYDNEAGITNITRGDDKTPVAAGSYDTKELIERVRVMIYGVDNLLASTAGIRLRDIGFSKI